jgi:hypothetical protein
MFRHAITFVVLGSSVPAFAVAACDEVAEGSKSYDKAVAQVRALPEFKSWLKYVSDHPGVKAVTMPSVDKQSLVRGRCYWSVTAYSDEGTHLHRWNTFYVSVGGKSILVENPEGEAVSLAYLRSNFKFESDGRKIGARPSP